MRNLNYFLKLLLGGIILLFLIQKIGFRDTFSNILTIHPLIILLVFAIILLTLLIGALNIYILSFPLKIRISFLKISKYATISWALGLFIPGKIGEFLLIPILKKGGVPLGQGAAISVLDKIITVITLTTLSILGFILFLDTGTTIKLALSIIFSILIFMFFIVSEMGRKLIKKYILKQYSLNFVGFYKSLSYFVRKQKSLLMLNFILTLFKWFFNSMLTYTLFIYYNNPVPAIYVYLITAMLVMVTLIPITISGLGIKESSATVLFSLLGIEPSLTLGIYIIQLIVTYILGTVILLFSLKEINIKPL